MISQFSQRIISGSDSMLIALLITAVLACIVRGHHTFMVGVDLDTMSQIESHLKMHHQDGIVKKGKIRSRNF